MYEFVQKLAKKKKKKEKKEIWDFNPGPIWLAIVDILSLIVVLLTSATGRCGLIRPPGRKLRPLSYPPHIEKSIKNPLRRLWEDARALYRAQEAWPRCRLKAYAGRGDDVVCHRVRTGVTPPR